MTKKLMDAIESTVKDRPELEGDAELMMTSKEFIIGSLKATTQIMVELHGFEVRDILKIAEAAALESMHCGEEITH